MKKIVSFLRWFFPIVFLAALGLELITYSTDKERKFLQGYETYAAATAALTAGDPKTAYVLYIQSAYELEDQRLKAVALYEAANTGWTGGIADYNTLVGLYQQSLRYDPGFYEAAFDLEYLYWLKANAPQQLPQPAPGPGPEPSRKEETPNGDV